MANIPCPTAINCEGSDFPILNFSSEGPDIFTWPGIYYPPNPHPCLVNCGPPTYYKPDCFGVVHSAVSQEEADLMARAASINCDQHANTCTNDPQTAIGFCPDGTEFHFTVPAGTFSAPYTDDLAACLATVNAEALAYAQAHLKENIVCLEPLARCTCINVPYSQTIHAQGNTSALTWTIFSGSLPPGLTFHGGFNILGQVLIDGTPIVAGTYSFTVMAMTAGGNYATKTYTISVIEVTTLALPDYTIGVPYSFQLQAVGGSGNYSWAITAGSLPNGLTMSSTGLITGTPV